MALICTGTGILALFILVSVIIIHLLFSTSLANKESFALEKRSYIEMIDMPYDIFKPYLEPEELSYLKRMVSVLNTSTILDAEFLKSNPQFVADLSNKNFSFFYSEKLGESCNLYSSIVENLYSVGVLDGNNTVPEKKCVLQFNIANINRETASQFVAQLKAES